VSVHRHHSDDKRPGDGRFTFARRWFWHWGLEEHREDAHLDVYVNRKPGHGWGGYLRFDGPDAESPVDAALFLGRWLAVFAGTSKGSRLNRWLRVTGSREIEVRLSLSDAAGRVVQNFLVEWSLWADPDHKVMTKWERNEMRKTHSAAYVWAYGTLRRGYHHPLRAVFDAVFGKTVYSVVKSDPVPTVVCLPEGDYPVTVTLRQATWKRPRSPRAWLRMATAEVEVVAVKDGGPGYIPTGRIKYGEDDGIVSSSGGRALTAREAADPELWVPIAVGAFTTSVLKDRAKYRRLGWVPEHPTDREITV